MNPAVPASLDGWVASVTEKQRELRPESAAEARRDLEAEARSLPAGAAARVARARGHGDPGTGRRRGGPRSRASDPAETVTIPGRALGRSKRKRRKGLWALGIVLALLAIGGAAWASWTYLIPHEVDVPKVVGLTVEDAQAQLERRGARRSDRGGPPLDEGPRGQRARGAARRGHDARTRRPRHAGPVARSPAGARPEPRRACRSPTPRLRSARRTSRSARSRGRSTSGSTPTRWSVRA